MSAVRPRFLVTGVASGATSVTLPDEEAHHLTRVLRLEPGAPVAIFDGAGHEWHGTVETAGRSAATVRLETAVTPLAEPAVAITLGVALQKGDRMDTIVSEATALGVAALVPMSTGHVALPARARESAAATARWRRVAVAAAKQCGRATVPDVRPVVNVITLLGGWRDGPVLVAVEPGRAWPGGADGAGPRPARALALVGPEGGWTDDEVQRLAGAGARRINLGPRILRGDLAPAVLLSALWTSWGWEPSALRNS
jgi:16S rRNA (uracil1498-N3)-methyltransferase